MYYHGSSIKGLKTLTPYISEHEKSYIYFATNPVVATFYMVHIVERPYNWFTYGFNEEGVPVYTEYYPNALFDGYDGKTGYLYECSEIDNVENPTNINCACVCDTTVVVDKCTEIKDIYEALLNYEKQGKLIIRRYETLSEKMLEFIEKTVRDEIKENNLKNNGDLSYSLFLKKNFCSVWNSVV